MKKELGDLKIDSADVKRRVNEILNADLRERKIYMKHKAFKTALIAAAVTTLIATSAFAVSPAGQEFIGNIISYFQSDQAVELTNMEALAKHNDAIGVSASKGRYTLTLDNVAADDNFVLVFYTVTSPEPIPMNPGWDQPADLYLICRLNGALPWTSNNNTEEGYFADENTYKGVSKYNVSSMELPDQFKLELYAERMGEDGKPLFEEGYLYSDQLTLTEADKEKLLYVSADIDKSEVEVETITKEVNQKIDFTDSELEKIIFSPFGNQFVMKTDSEADDTTAESKLRALGNFALFDENGTALDVLTTDLTLLASGVTRNSFEFLKGSVNTKQLEFVPYVYKDPSDADIAVLPQRIGSYPLIYEVSDYGRIVVTDIRFANGRIEIDYYQDGTVLFGPTFDILDDSGASIAAGKQGCAQYTRVNYEENTYTGIFKFGTEGAAVSEEELRAEFTTLGVYRQGFVQLDFEHAITVDLK